MDSHNLEPQELNDRIRLYSHKLSQQWSTLQEDSPSAANGNDIQINQKMCKSKQNFIQTISNFMFTGLLKDIPNSEAERLLMAVPISDADLHLVS